MPQLKFNLSLVDGTYAMKVKTIDNCILYQSCGSYGLLFSGYDGKNYEFLVETKPSQDSSITKYNPPVIFFDDCNSSIVVKKLGWQEAKDFIARLKYDKSSHDNCFIEMVNVINGEGCIA